MGKGYKNRWDRGRVNDQQAGLGASAHVEMSLTSFNERSGQSMNLSIVFNSFEARS
jgi:hypothetical protein